MVKEEIILCAAIWFRDLPRLKDNPHHPINTNHGIVFCGHRHGHIIAQLNCLLGKSQHELGESIQGFLTSKNRFIDRSEAAELFIKNGGKPDFETRLFSEDLY